MPGSPRPRSPKSKPPSPRPKSQGGSSSGGSSLRLSLGGSKSKGDSSPKRSGSPKLSPSRNNSPSNTSSSPNTASKKRKYTPPSNVPPHLAMASFARVHHQNTHLSLVFDGNGDWNCRGESVLYVTDAAPPMTTVTQLALHLRGSCQVDSVQVETVGEVPKELKQEQGIKQEEGVKKEETNPSPQSASLETWKTSFDHFDPLEHVLIKPATSYTDADCQPAATAGEETAAKKKKYDADSQFSRNAPGMITGLRAASIASNMGELRLSIDRPSTSAGRPNKTAAPLSKEERDARKEWFTAQWKLDLERPPEGASAQALHSALEERTEQRREARIQLVAERLAESSDTDLGRRAFKIRVRYRFAEGVQHAGGLHVLKATAMLPPHIYTTSGVFGDHEGARSWIPCLDSASYKHRASHQFTVSLTAAMREGLQVIGCGEDAGAYETWLHYKDGERSDLEKWLGKDHAQWIEQSQKRESKENGNKNNKEASTNSAPHMIPPDTDAVMEDTNSDEANRTVASIDYILATQVWASTSWMPIPARSLGFCVGPFFVVEDPEYFGLPDFDTEDGGGGGEHLQHRRQLELEREQERIESARERGEGIRQAFFAPVYDRKHIHVGANTMLLEESPSPQTDNGYRSNVVDIQLLPRTARQVRVSKDLEDTVLFATAGIPHRALSLMRDILALPAYRTSAYTQVWIPHAVNGGVTSGALHNCPEVLGANPFLGGAVMDAGLLPPVGKRIPFYQGGGRVLQLLQARCAIRGWIISSLPLGAQDDVGGGYIHSLIESFMMSFYERGHGAFGEGGAKGSFFYTKRYSTGSGLNSVNLDFLPVRNVDEAADVAVGGVMAAVPVEDRNNDQLWRSPTNGTESHTSAMDEFSVRQLLCRDAVDALERGTDKDKYVPMPSMNWLGSHLCLSFLSSNANSSSDLGGGAVELVHATGGLVYRALKTQVLHKVVEGRAGVANFIRTVRAAFIASHLDDMGEKELKMPSTKKEKRPDRNADAKAKPKDPEPAIEPPKPRFVICVNELLKKKGLTHLLLTNVLKNLSGRIREALLLGRLVDIEKEAIDPTTKHPIVAPEGFPNSFVRAASSLHLRVGVHVDVSRDSASSSAAANPGGIQLQAYAEPVIPEGGVAFSGPITLRVVENEGQLREFVKELTVDGSRRDWGTTHLHAQPVTTSKAQTAASGVIESTAKEKARKGGQGIFGPSVSNNAGGYQAIELIRLTNLTPLLWVRVDPMGLYGGRVTVFQQDACLAEQLFHDGDAGAQVEALRVLAERPLQIQGSVKVTSIYDVRVSELPVRVLGDCLRGSPALHSSLPHTPAVRAQAAFAIAQWQNNKAPPNNRAGGVDQWLGLNLLLQYFRERYYKNGIIMPAKYTRVVVKKNEVEAAHEAAAVEGGGPNPNPKHDLSYQYLDGMDALERATALEDAEEIGVEEDEEYRVRSAVIGAIASIRAKDGMTPPQVLNFLETILEGEDTEMAGNVVVVDEDIISEKNNRRAKEAKTAKKASNGFDDTTLAPYPYVSSALVAESLLALCQVNVFPELITDPATGKPVQSSASHPATKLIEISLRWLQWELYRESVRREAELETMTGIAAGCNDTVAVCAITALSTLAIQRQSTTDPVKVSKPIDAKTDEKESDKDKKDEEEKKESIDDFFDKPLSKLDEIATVQFYIDIFDRDPAVSDLTKAACAQAVACLYCAADRFEKKGQYSVGLLAALEFLLDRINEESTSAHLKHTLALLMMDVCTGKVCSNTRVAAIAGRNDLVASAARFYNGPLGASHGTDVGSACLTAVAPNTYPAAQAVNDGALKGLGLLNKAGNPKFEAVREETVVRIARFASNLWRVINGECVVPQRSGPPKDSPIDTVNGVCAYDGHLRCALLSLWLWLWPKRCYPVLQVQAWKAHEGTKKYIALGAGHVMKCSDEEKAAAAAEDTELSGINRLVKVEIERQKWRGEMAMKAYEFQKNKQTTDITAAEQGIGQPLPPIERDPAFKSGGWIASASQQRRKLALDGGTNVTKLRLTVGSN